MSQETTGLARVQRTGSPRNKVVLMLLADYAPANSNICKDVSQRQLAFEAEITDRTLRTCINELVGKNFISVENSTNNKGLNSTNIYRLLLTNWATLTSYRNPANPQLSYAENSSLRAENLSVPSGKSFRTEKTAESGGNVEENETQCGKIYLTSKESSKETRLDYLEGSDFLSFVKRYNQIADDHENVKGLADDKHQAYAERINAIRDAFTPQQIETVFEKIPRNNWLIGLALGDNGRKFTLNMGYLVAFKKSYQEKNNFQRILDGEHDKWQTPKGRSDQHKFKSGEKPYAHVSNWDDEFAKIKDCKLKTAKERFDRIAEYFDRSEHAKYVIGKGHTAQLTVMVFNFIFLGMSTKSNTDIDYQFMNNKYFPDCFQPPVRKRVTGGVA